MRSNSGSAASSQATSVSLPKRGVTRVHSRTPVAPGSPLATPWTKLAAALAFAGGSASARAVPGRRWVTNRRRVSLMAAISERAPGHFDTVHARRAADEGRRAEGAAGIAGVDDVVLVEQ